MEEKGKTNLSNELRGKVINARKIEKDEEEERGWYKEATMMNRSSVVSDCLEGKCSIPSLVDDIEENYFTG